MRYKKFKIYQFLGVSLFIFFVSISYIHASCSGLQVVDNWEWLDRAEFSNSKKAVFEHYLQMTEQYLDWRKSTNFTEPNTFNTVASKARILLVNEAGVVEDIIEANHGRRILHVDPKILTHSSPDYFHETMFFPGEEAAYLNILEKEQQALRMFGDFRSWCITTLFTNQHPMIKDAMAAYNKITSERLFYTEQIENRKKSITPGLRAIRHDLRTDIYKDEDKGGEVEIESKNKKEKKKVKQIFLYRDLHEQDGEAFACDSLLKSLKTYQVKGQYDKQKIKAFVLFLNERDPCLCCSVTIKDYLSEAIFRKGLCSEVIPIVVSLDNYKERAWDESLTDIIIRDKIKASGEQKEQKEEEEEEEEETETVSPLPPPILRLYRDEGIKGTPIKVANDIRGMFQRKVKESSSWPYWKKCLVGCGAIASGGGIILGILARRRGLI